MYIIECTHTMFGLAPINENDNNYKQNIPNMSNKMKVERQQQQQPQQQISVCLTYNITVVIWV